MENKNTDDKIDSIVKAFGKNAKSFSDILTQLLNRNVGENAFNINVLTAKKPKSIKTLPNANSKHRGDIYLVKGDNGTADTLYICLKSSSDTYSWVTIATG